MEGVNQGKAITEAFPHLQLQGDLQEYLSDAVVTRVALDRENSRLCIFLTSRNWIRKKYIYGLEDEIRRQLFSDVPVEVCVTEDFRLSVQYTPERIWDVYQSSMLLECRRKDVLLFYLLQKADLLFRDQKSLELTLEDSPIGHEKEKELLQYLTHVFAERCHLPIQIEVFWKEKSEKKQRENKEAQFKEEARQIFARSSDTVSEEDRAKVQDVGKDTKADSSGIRARVKDPAGRQKDLHAEETPKENPDLIYGKYFDGDSTDISDLDETTGEAIIRGEIVSLDMRELKNEKVLLLFAVTDYTDTIRVKIFSSMEQSKTLEKRLSPGSFVRVQGRAAIDTFERELTVSYVRGIREGKDFRAKRMDTAAVRRVELHCHTKMSEMDGVSDAGALIKRAKEWGHPAIAITDHGVVQAFPDANKAMKGDDSGFKVLYGCEAYVVDDLRGIAVDDMGQSLRDSYVVFDIETTGLSNLTCRIIEIGAVRVTDGEITDRFSTFVNPEIPIPFHIEKLTGISDTMVENAPTIEQVLPEFLAFVGDDALVAHNADFDVGFIRKACRDQGIKRTFTQVDTLEMAHFLLPQLGRFTLDKVAKAVQVPLDNHHRAVDDAACTAGIFTRFIVMLEEHGIYTLKQMNEAGAMTPHAVSRLREHHAVLLAQNETGRVNLYRLISEAHLNYLQNKPKFPKSIINKYHEGILIGSGCSDGELYQALLSGASEEEIARLVAFYNYLEVQPVGNSLFLLEDEKEEAVQTEEDLRDLIRKIVKLGEQFHKPVAATGDVHYMDPEDVIYRKIIKAGKLRKDRDEYDLDSYYFRTTNEMLEEFAFLGEEKAWEIVVDNPRSIAERIEKISPIREGKFPPVIADSDKTLREICEKKAHDMYGKQLPEIVAARLEKELNSIISNGYAVLYIIAQKLIWQCNEDGYLVGSRGSVGSSFAATMAGITEVNPLPPHYLCPECHYVDFDSEIVKHYAAERIVGTDLPDKTCPCCGAPLQKLGFQIPFETFLGFKGNKEPDIDLNFSGEYQSRAHKNTEILFGKGQTFRAGTIGTMAEKTAFGYVRKYFEEKNIYKRNCEFDRIVKGCVGVRRTTGQHPGGIIVVPHGEDINSFTPVQHPADDPNSDIISTHFDYHSIDENLLKLDLLGHDDPTMIKVLEELTDTDATKVPLDEPKVMSLFKNTEALGIRPEDIAGCPLGCLGVPEFGTDNTMQMVIEIQPKNFTDLIQISGLAHGTDVWHGNAQTLIQEGRCAISEAICTRDDIMGYLIGKGLDSEESFTIMERVRKGTVAKGKCKEWPQFKKDMQEHNVPDWYIWSCEKIKYMFPKAHAVAYVMMAYRIAWYKVYYPLAYYAAYFAIRASAFSYETMCGGKERLKSFLTPLRERYNDEKTKRQMSNLEKDTYKDMRLVEEMYARGFDFVPIDLYKVKAHRFQIVGNSLMASLDSIEGLGEKAAESIVQAAAEGPFLSKDDFRRRTKTAKTMIDKLDNLGILKDLPETDQISLMDMLQ